jgi:rhizosphere induced protein
MLHYLPVPSASLGGVTYSLVFKNNSSNYGFGCVYQTDPDITDPTILSLAWFSKSAHPTTKVVFSWTIDYSFVWSETGTLKPGVLFIAGQTWDADLTTTNQVTFSYTGGAYTFQNQQAGAKPGNLYVKEDATIPLKQASVGIGMSGAGTFVKQAQPNLQLTFTPHPKYWIAFGDFTPGEVLDIGSITNPYEIVFPPGVTSMTAVLNQDNSWSGGTTADYNARFLEAHDKNRDAKWGDD